MNLLEKDELTLTEMLKITGIILLIFTIILLVGLASAAQNLPIITSNINYKAETVDTYLYKVKQHNTFVSETIFEFKDNKIITNNKDNTKTFYIKGVWQKSELNGYKVKYIQAEDMGGFALVVFIGYIPESMVYFIIPSYKNVETFYIVKPSKFGIPEGYIPMKGHIMYDGEYTTAEMIEFIKFLSVWGVNITQE